MLLTLLRQLLYPTVEVPMITTVFKVRVTTADGFADLTMERDKQSFVPRADDTLHVTVCPCSEDAVIEADVVEVVYDPNEEVAEVRAATDLDLADGYKIEAIVEAARQDGWELDGDVEFHGCCKGLCPCDVAKKPECDPAVCAKPECAGGTCKGR